MPTLHLDIVTPEKTVVSAQTDDIVAPGALGLFGVRPGHAPFLTTVEPGELSFRVEEKRELYVIGGGFIEVSGDHVIVLADTAEKAREIDLERARRAQADALQRLASLREEDAEYRLQETRLRRAVARIRLGVSQHTSST